MIMICFVFFFIFVVDHRSLQLPIHFFHPLLPFALLAALPLFFVLLALLPVASAALASQGLALFDSFYRAGALVFGGGHVVLPLLETEVVRSGWVGQEAFLDGRGSARAVRGQRFS